MTTSGIPAGFLLQALADQSMREAVNDGLKAAVRLYYDDMTDADEVDPSFMAALVAVGEYQDDDVAELVAEVETAIRDETGRRFGSQAADDDLAWARKSLGRHATDDEVADLARTRAAIRERERTNS